MTQITPPRPLAYEDDRNLFDCGRESINQWFRRHAWFNQSESLSRINVICDMDAENHIIGFVSLSAAQIERAYLPKSQQRNRPNPVPAILLGQLAIDKNYQGQGHAASLLFFALKTALHLSQSIGCSAVITHPLDESLRGFYARWGFQDLPFDPKRAMIVRMNDLQKSFGEDPTC